MYKPGVDVSVQSTEKPTADLTDISKLKIKMEQLEKLRQDMNKPGVSVISYLREIVTVEQFTGFFHPTESTIQSGNQLHASRSVIQV